MWKRGFAWLAAPDGLLSASVGGLVVGVERAATIGRDDRSAVILGQVGTTAERLPDTLALVAANVYTRGHAAQALTGLAARRDGRRWRRARRLAVEIGLG